MLQRVFVKVMFIVVLLVILGMTTQRWLPWWGMALWGLGLGLWLSPGVLAGFGAGFLGGFLLWGGYAAWLNQANGGLLAGRIGEMLGGLSPWSVVIGTALLGGLLGGLSVLTGVLARGLRNAPLDSTPENP